MVAMRQACPENRRNGAVTRFAKRGNDMNINLFMAIFWLVLGLGLAIYHTVYPHEQFLRMKFIDISPGWLIMILAVWNIIRWWSSRAAERDRRYEEDAVYQ